MCKDVFRVKPMIKADTNVINQPLINSTSNVTVDSGKQSMIGDSVLMYASWLARHDGALVR